MPFTIVRQDITKIRADAIVNAANTDLQMGGGVSRAIFEAAGVSQLQAACDRIGPIKTGEAVITPGFGLPAKFIIHTAGPIYRPGEKEQNEHYLRLAYTNSLKRALENDCKSIAFPLISSGIYGYPKDEALQVATSAIEDFLKDNDIDISLVFFDKAAFSISQKLLEAVASYLDKHHIETRESRSKEPLELEQSSLFKTDELISKENEPVFIEIFDPSSGAATPLDALVGNLDEPFSRMLLRLIDAKEMSDVEVYKRANLDRKLFSKIRSNKNYMPSKRTALALAVALKLSLDETDELLERAGYALSHAVKFDVIVEYFITNGKYNIFEINEVLFEYDQPLLGGQI